MVTNCEPLECPTICPEVFDRLVVRPTITHGTTVEWLLRADFIDPAPHVYQLQVGHTGVNQADDWEDVGLPAENVAILSDDQQRVFGKTQWTHYRVQLTTPMRVYYSTPVSALSQLEYRWWRVALARERQWLIQLRNTIRGNDGFLLKRKLAGERPADDEFILDYLTEEVIQTSLMRNLSTEYIGGYYAPIPCIWADLDRFARREELDGDKSGSGGSRGTINEIKTKARFLGHPLLDEEDVWVSKSSDLRWYIGELQNIEEMSFYPILVQADIRLAPFTDPIYQIPMPG